MSCILMVLVCTIFLPCRVSTAHYYSSFNGSNNCDTICERKILSSFTHLLLKRCRTILETVKQLLVCSQYDFVNHVLFAKYIENYRKKPFFPGPTAPLPDAGTPNTRTHNMNANDECIGFNIRIMPWRTRWERQHNHWRRLWNIPNVKTKVFVVHTEHKERGKKNGSRLKWQMWRNEAASDVASDNIGTSLAATEIDIVDEVQLQKSEFSSRDKRQFIEIATTTRYCMVHAMKRSTNHPNTLHAARWTEFVFPFFFSFAVLYAPAASSGDYCLWVGATATVVTAASLLIWKTTF